MVPLTMVWVRTTVICSGFTMPNIPIAFLTMAQSDSPYPNAGSFAALGAIVATIRRKSPIGGWLFFFMWQAFIGCVFSIAQIVRDWHFYTPGAW